MTVLDNVKDLLLHSTGEYVSGEQMAHDLVVSRAAVWKAIKAMEEQGYPIEAVRNKGYRLQGPYDIVSSEGISQHLSSSIANSVKLDVRQSTGSTNNDVRALAEAGAPEFTVVVAGEQQQGRGRRGRPFYSLGDTGVYLSILLKPEWRMDRATRITCAAAVAVCRTLERVAGVKPSIKWVNDVYVGPQKVCGILTEGVADLETGGLSFAVVGIGVNVYTPDGGFPEAFSGRAGSVFDHVRTDARNEIAAMIISEFLDIYRNDEDFVEEYRAKSFLPGRKIAVLDGSADGRAATAISIEDDLNLRVRYDNGEEQCLNSGEVSIRVEGETPSH